MISAGTSLPSEDFKSLANTETQSVKGFFLPLGGLKILGKVGGRFVPLEAKHSTFFAARCL